MMKSARETAEELCLDARPTGEEAIIRVVTRAIDDARRQAFGTGFSAGWEAGTDYFSHAEGYTTSPVPNHDSALATALSDAGIVIT